jgi:ankyrin repeat protein
MKRAHLAIVILSVVVVCLALTNLITLAGYFFQRTELQRMRKQPAPAATYSSSERRTLPHELPGPDDMLKPVGPIKTAVEAVFSGDVNKLSEILESQPELLDMRSGDSGNAMLHHAAYRGKLAVVKELLRRNAKVNILNAYGSTPLQDCVSGDSGTAEIASLLLKQGADFRIPNRSGQTPLQRALAKNRDDLVHVLEEHGAKQ